MVDSLLSLLVRSSTYYRIVVLGIWIHTWMSIGWKLAVITTALMDFGLMWSTQGTEQGHFTDHIGE